MKQITLLVCTAITIFFFSCACASITDITVYEKDGVTTNNYPLTFGHLFRQGDAPSHVSVKIGGSSVPTQCDIKSTYSDGSIRFAVLSLLIPTIPANGTVVLSLEAGGTNANTATLTKSEIQATNIDAQISLTNLSGSGYSGNLTADLSSAINDTANIQYWLSGDITTEVIVQQRLNNSLNAVWEVRIYPGTNYKRISHSIENIEANYRGNVDYGIGIFQGMPTLTSVYTKASFQHNQSSRWRKVFWVGDEPPEVEIHYNLPYLISTGMIPNYDTSLTVPETTISSAYSQWNSSDTDIGGNGLAYYYFPNTGGRQEIGFFPTWTARYLLSMDNRMREITLKQADLMSTCPIHYREFNPAKTFYKKFINIDDRPQVRTDDVYANDSGYDPLGAAIGTLATNWTVDMSHQGSFNFVPYIVTGEYYYLQEMQYWAAWDLSKIHYDSSWGRDYSTGILKDQIRGTAWGFRNVAHAALLSLDGSMEKLYFTNKVNNNIAFWATKVASRPLRHASMSEGDVAGGVNTSLVEDVTSGWMEDFFLLSLNEADRFGFDTESVVTEYSKFVIGRFYSGSGFNPYLGDAYRFPTQIKSDLSTVATWEQARSLYITPDATSWATVGYTYSYRHIALAALAGVTGRPNGLAAYTWLKNNINCSVTMDDDPTWGLLPTVSSPGSGRRYRISFASSQD